MKKIHMKNHSRNPLSLIVEASATHPGKSLLVMGIITTLFMIPAAQLKIQSNIEGFIGGDVPEDIKQFQQVSSEFGEQELVTIVIDCSQSTAEAAEGYIDDLAERLQENEWFTGVQYNQNMGVAEENLILYVSQEGLQFLLDPQATPESAEEIFENITAQVNTPSYIVSETGSLYLLNIVLSAAITDLNIRTDMFEGLNSLIHDVQSQDPEYRDLEIGITGGLMVIDYETDQMAINDIYLTVIVAFVLILILLFISFRGLSLPFLMIIPLICGIITTTGLFSIIYGSLHMFAAVFAVLLLGIGVDFSIHFLNRFLEEITDHDDMQQAFMKTSLSTGKAILLGTLTTATAFGALYFSRLQGIMQMGIILALGLLITLTCVLAILPALLTLRLRRGSLRKKLHKRATFSILHRIGSFSYRHAPVMLILLLVIGGLFVYRAPGAEMNDDIHSLQPKTVPAYAQLEKVKNHFNYSEDHLLCVADSFDQLKEHVSLFGEIEEIVKIESILTFLPENQNEKLAILSEALNVHPEFKDISWIPQEEMSWRDLPPQIQKDWVSLTSEGERFLIRLTARGDIWDEAYRNMLLVKAGDNVPPIVSRSIMWSTFVNMLSDDVQWITAAIIIPIFFIVYIGFGKKNPFHAVLSFVPVIFGILGILALSGPLNISLDIASVMLIPLVVGIGIDDGIHILHRYLEEGPGSIPGVIHNAGRAIFLTTATTCIAFSSFLIAEHPQLRSMGQVPVLGLILCFIATVIFLPALVRVIGEKKR
ncbi:MAG: MMPL family transporter [Theionarchaea archaeon]|nr:MMPL family transporter [Theionarchaea archaeon]